MVYESHWFRFDNREDHSRFDALMMQGIELANRYDQALSDILIQDVLARGGHRQRPGVA